MSIKTLAGGLSFSFLLIVSCLGARSVRLLLLLLLLLLLRRLSAFLLLEVGNRGRVERLNVVLESVLIVPTKLVIACGGVFDARIEHV